jgi:hypothetical protein
MTDDMTNVGRGNQHRISADPRHLLLCWEFCLISKLPKTNNTCAIGKLRIFCRGNFKRSWVKFIFTREQGLIEMAEKVLSLYMGEESLAGENRGKTPDIDPSLPPQMGKFR